MVLKKVNALKGEITVPGDKSISHRAVMLGSLAKGTTEITHFLNGADCLSTIDCFRSMGIDIENDPFKNKVVIHGKGLHGLRQPDHILNVGNSGTTMRLLSGILCGQAFTTQLTGDDSIKRRPMGRVITPLSQMGANIKSLMGNNCAPF
jgi:3-phosphoshikimate 1-carboxyvinyltransferase